LYGIDKSAITKGLLSPAAARTFRVATRKKFYMCYKAATALNMLLIVLNATKATRWELRGSGGKSAPAG
jgi:hypothetical protein